MRRTSVLIRGKVVQFARGFTQSRHILGLKPFLLADVGEGIKECEVIQWYVQPNARVDEFDPICEVQSDKATVEITSRYSGVIKTLHYDVGQMAQVGSPLLDIDADGAPEMPATAVNTGSEVPGTATSDVGVVPHSLNGLEKTSSKTIATPAVRRLCREHSIDMSTIQGTGKDSRVMKEDVLKLIGQEQKPVSQCPVISGDTGADKIVPLKGVAKQMFNSMSKSASIPHFLYTEEIEMDNLKALRARANKALDIKLSFMPFMIKALSIALTHYPIANGRLVPDQTAVEYRKSHNIAIAMDTPSGLVVPSIKNCESRSIIEIGHELIRLQVDGAAGKLSSADLQGGTITLSNIGSTGGMYVAPVIVDSQVCIGGVGRIRKLPRFDENDNVVAKNVMCCSWAGDHRVLDGMTVALLVSRWKKLLENPDEMLLELK